MGWSIITLTLIIKTLLVPLAWKSYVSMSKMKKLQPEMEKIKERVGDDRQKMQQEMMALYKKEKVNPASGCLPILLQIPIFFSLYKVLFVTIEMRHAPFIGWIHDLSAPDPTSIINLFGLLPFAPPGPESIFYIFSIGVFPILMGITMWLQQKLNPAPTDPTQAMIFAWMPWVFMFMLGTFASGLVIYWVANNTITFIQQYFIMRSQGVKADIFGNILAGFKRKKAEGKVTWSLAEAYRFPVKGLGGEALGRIRLETGRAIPHDRVWAIAHGGNAEASASGWIEPGSLLTADTYPGARAGRNCLRSRAQRSHAAPSGPPFRQPRTRNRKRRCGVDRMDRSPGRRYSARPLQGLSGARHCLHGFRRNAPLDRVDPVARHSRAGLRAIAPTSLGSA